MVDEEIGMPAKRELSMRQLRHLLRLHHDGVSAREIGRRLGVARSTIQDNLKRAAAGLTWPLADDVTEEALEHRLIGRAGVTQGQRRLPIPTKPPVCNGMIAPRDSWMMPPPCNEMIPPGAPRLLA